MTKQVWKWLDTLIVTLAVACSSGAFAKNYAYTDLPETVQAAKAGNTDAQYELGLRYETGEGVDRNYQSAKKWYQAAAEQGHTKALFEMGILHAMGRFTQDTELAKAESKKWFKRLADGYIVVDENFYIWRNRIERKSRLKSGSVSDIADRIAWLRKTSPSGHIEAQRYLGYLYDKGYTVFQSIARNCVEAAGWYEKAALQGDATSQQRMGDLSVVCKGIPADYQKSADWHRRAANQGNVTSQITLSGIYKVGKNGIPVDYKKSAYWLALAAEQGNKVAQKGLGNRYKDGLGVPKDFAIAQSWYEKAAAQGYDPAQQALVDLRRSTGQGSPNAYETLQLLAMLWISLDTVSDITEEPKSLTDSSSVEEAISQCREDVYSRAVRCYSSSVISSCQMVGGCDYEWICQTRRGGRGKCSPGSGYTDKQVEYYCDPKVGIKYDTEELLLAKSCH